jgi:hypothetical protein
LRPNLTDVLAATRPGQVVRLKLTPEQRRSLQDREARLALDVVRHLLGARAASFTTGEMPATFPLTEATFQAVALRLGANVGIKRSRSLLRRLRAAGVLCDAGSYRQPYTRQGSSGYRVSLFRLGALVAALRRKRAIGRGPRVKGGRLRRWWEGGLFGDLYGLPPPGYSRAQLRRMRSADEVWNMSRAAA